MQFAAYLKDSTGKLERREVEAYDEESARRTLEAEEGMTVVELRELPPQDSLLSLADGWRTTCILLAITTFGLGMLTAGAMMFIPVHPPVMMLFFGWMILGIGFSGLANQRLILVELRRRRR
ncbi:hypothetical protein LOC68_12845 [Blastopirellula sp. JC732]|uniref:Uncharacterized protein n=1 Tax=Blastopirellula sediminis TaxID=2894196 RepID=A0A9X1MPL5_9BACT|nr:hypothetical protein [Blastopirellula sediminis]MCC9607423.1 hypothetical protein [Blastopirellula sediminis]MCC9629284.1 hypothetical protein [Blastopirellula sediminis]